MFNDWGWHYTSTLNLNKVKKFAYEYPQPSHEDKIVVGQRVDKMLSHIENRPKSFKWKKRTKVRTKTKWFNPVEDQ